MAPPIRLVNERTTATCLRFKLATLDAHVDQLLELHVGKHSTTLSIEVSFQPHFGGLGPRPPELSSASLLLYASDAPKERVADYRYLEEVPMDRMDKSVLAFSDVSGTVYLALFATLRLQDVVVSCAIGGPVPEEEDVRHPWRISRMYHVNNENYDTVVTWLVANRTRLVLKTYQFVSTATGGTPLHLLCGAAGDPKLARLFLERCQRFINPELQDKRGDTAIAKLLARHDIYDVRSPLYYRALELIELFLREAAVSSDVEDCDGNTLVHLAACRHRRDSRLLPRLLELGAPSNIRNAAGKTPLQLARESGPATGMMDMDLLEASRLLDAASASSAHAARPLRSLRVLDQLPRRSDDACAASAKASGVTSTFAPLVIRVDDDGLPVGSDGKRLPSAVAEARLRAEFDLYDTAQRGYLTTAQMRAVYQAYDSFGVTEAAHEVEALVRGGGQLGPGKVSYEEFCMVIFRINER